MEIITIALLLVIAAEATYLVAVNTKKISHKKEVRPIFVDTSVLMDGRIIAVAQSGFISGKLSIPRSVIGELQFLADNADNEKRARARHGLDVVNVNDLAMSLRMAYLPGEKMMLELTQKGQDVHQAIGHLTDGTMVVVEHANNCIGQTVEIEFIRSLQTAAGKMMFAKLVERKPTKVEAPVVV